MLTSRLSSSSGPGYVELIERRATSATPPTGDEVTVGRDSAVVTDQDGVTRLWLTRSGTAVVVVTNLGRPEAIAVAVSLQGGGQDPREGDPHLRGGR